nr:PAS domain-containing protein [Aquabacterium terrae]
MEGSGLALFDWDIAGDRIYHDAQASAMRDEPAVETTASAAEWRSFVHPDDLDAMRASLKATLKAEVLVYHAEFRIRKRLGDWLWVHARWRVVERDVNGRAVRLAGTVHDHPGGPAQRDQREDAGGKAGGNARSPDGAGGQALRDHGQRWRGLVECGRY